MNKKILGPAFAMAFVWFTTHFGGGFASGAQIVQYFVKYGWIGMLVPIASQGFQAYIFYRIWKFAVERRAFNYRKWSLEFYKPASQVGSFLFEVVYQLLLVTATAVAFATGGATIEALFKSSYLLNTVIIAGIIWLLTIFGASTVRKAATTIAIAIFIAIFAVYIPNIVVNWGHLVQNISNLQTGVFPSDGNFWSAMWSGLTYAALQTSCVGAYIAHTDILEDVGMAKKAAFIGFLVNATILTMATVGLMAFYHIPAASDPNVPAIFLEKVPAVFIVQNGVGEAFMTPMISLMIILGVVSTGVSLIYGTVNRITSFLSRNESDEVAAKKDRFRSTVISLAFVILTWSVAQFGLIPLVAQGYKYIGYITLLIIILPVLVRVFYDWNPVESKKEK